jgi:hypothetical protein
VSGVRKQEEGLRNKDSGAKIGIQNPESRREEIGAENQKKEWLSQSSQSPQRKNVWPIPETGIDQTAPENRTEK